ncbi:hypothetical protein N7457_008869 [Penicillium paradoxum]|uniref:uncharacterized protein n=1 Tax=Penicillium paradoxum TaxID=176176 RepID=UPI002549A5E2|nr:uncharacterized protein N7457_008869 [Penicillium paradoxum]KAJ5773973.1 hypothetical protein N7457_008869 [Penicillium paradoxum]
MIRRPPTIIALEEQDVESHLQRIYLRHSLPIDFEQLRLDEDESFDDLQLGQSPMSSYVSSDLSDVDIDTTDPGHEGPLCSALYSGYTSSPEDRSHALVDATPQSRSVTKSCLKSPISSKQRSSLQKKISSEGHSYRANLFVDPPRLKVKFTMPPPGLELHNGKVHLPPEEGAGTYVKPASLNLGSDSQSCSRADRDHRGENEPISHKDTIYTPMAIDSPSSTPQVSFLSCGVSSSPATSVPLRDLALACTMSYEAALAEETASPASAKNINPSEDCGSRAKFVT